MCQLGYIVVNQQSLHDLLTDVDDCDNDQGQRNLVTFVRTGDRSQNDKREVYAAGSQQRGIEGE